MAKTYQLAFNNEPLDLTDLKHPAVNYYMKAMEQLGDYKKGQNPKLSFPIEFEFRNEFYELANPYAEDTPETHCQKLSLPTSCMVSIKVDEQMVQGRFTIFENIMRDDNNKTILTPKSMDIDPRMVFEDDINTNIQLFFMLFASTYTEPLKGEDGKPMLKYHNGIANKKKFLIVRNTRKEQTEDARTKRLSADVNTLIWSEEHGLEQSKLMEIAAIYGIKNAGNAREIESVRLALDAMIDKKSLPDMLSFMKQVSSESDINVKTTIITAKELELIYIDKAKTNSYYKAKDIDGTEITLCTCKKLEEPEETLEKTLLSDYEKFRKLKNIVNNKQKELDS